MLRRAPLKWGRPLKRKTPLRARSKQTERLYEQQREPFVVAFLEAHPVCEKCWQTRSQAVHEPLMRSHGGSIVDEANAMAVCFFCHAEIHANPAASYASGWLVPSWEATA